MCGPSDVLYIEDDDLDVLLMRRAWRKVALANPLHVLRDGHEAEAYLAGSGKYANRTVHPMPGLVLSDLNLPRISGLDLLKWIREQPTIQALPVILLSSSNLSRDIQRATALGANAYWVKPLDPRELEKMVMSLKQLWA
jgi:CheY-like chemotaxis protein